MIGFTGEGEKGKESTRSCHVMTECIIADLDAGWMEVDGFIHHGVCKKKKKNKGRGRIQGGLG